MRAQSKSRRNFLLAAGAGGVATVAGVTAIQSGKRPDKRVKAPEAAGGYHVTDHIRNYYRTAKV